MNVRIVLIVFIVITVKHFLLWKIDKQLNKDQQVCKITCENTKNMLSAITNIVSEDIKHNVENRPDTYKYHDTFQLSLSKKIESQELLKIVVNKLTEAGYIDNGCTCKYNKKKDEYTLKVKLHIYPFTQEEINRFDLLSILIDLPYYVLFPSMIALLIIRLANLAPLGVCYICLFLILFVLMPISMFVSVKASKLQSTEIAKIIC